MIELGRNRKIEFFKTLLQHNTGLSHTETKKG